MTDNTFNHPDIKPDPQGYATVESLPTDRWVVVATQIKIHDWLRWVDWLIPEAEINAARERDIVVTCHRRRGAKYELVARRLPKQWHKRAPHNPRRGDVRNSFMART